MKDPEAAIRIRAILSLHSPHDCERDDHSCSVRPGVGCVNAGRCEACGGRSPCLTAWMAADWLGVRL